ncbi:MAG: hypothetical protein ACYS0E_20830 [Planctomycetota bacterium]|jgi:hypothetical protein
MRYLAALALATIVMADSGQGPVDSGPVLVENLRLGTYWYGAKITNKDLIGKVVLVEIWGS